MATNTHGNQQQRYLNLAIAGITNNSTDLLLTHFVGEEWISKPYRYQLSFLSLDPDLINKIPAGQSVAFSFCHHSEYSSDDDSDHRIQPFHGCVNQITKGLQAYDNYWSYQLEVVPWFELLKNSCDSRRYLNQSAPDIIKSVFADHGRSDYDLTGLTNSYPPLPYCVRYQESARDFVSRLMVEHGIYYSFRHHHNKHTMVLEDGLLPAARYDKSLQDNHYHYWQTSTASTVTKKLARVYQLQKPTEPLAAQSLVSSTCKKKLPVNTSKGSYHFSTQISAQSDADLTAIQKRELDAARLEQQAFHSAGNYGGLYAGMQVSVENENSSQTKNNFYIHQIKHEARDSSQRGHHVPQEGPEHFYQNKYWLTAANCRCLSRHPISKPQIPGALPALVVTPAGTELYSHRYAEIKVQMHWDRHSNFDENSSDWIRTTQQFAGNGWGKQWLPRTGQEVLTVFADGNPDRPSVWGGYYNAANTHPYSIQTQSGIKTHSIGSKQEGQGHQLRFDDQAKDEQIFVKSQKDQLIRVKDNSNKKISNTSNTKVNSGVVASTVGGIHKITAAKTLHLKVSGSEIVLNGQGVNLHSDQVNMKLGSGATAAIGLASKSALEKEPNNTASIAELIQKLTPTTYWVQATYKGSKGQPISNLSYVITHSNGQQFKGVLNAQGKTKRRSMLNENKNKIIHPTRL